MIQQSYKNNKSTLYLVPTPIGNLKDITYRAIEILNNVDIIYCEDTRISIKLLNHYNIRKELISYHDFNEEEKSLEIINKLSKGLNIALITDAGMPAISDPGYILIKKVIKKGYNLVVLPGASAGITALVSSGLKTQPHTFLGFLPRKQNEQISFLENYKYRKETLIIYESPKRITKTLININNVLDNPKIALIKELTKVYETIIRGRCRDVLKENIDTRGEFIIIVCPNESKELFKDLSITQHVTLYLKQGYLEKEALKQVAKDLNKTKSEIYKIYKLGGKQ